MKPEFKNRDEGASRPFNGGGGFRSSGSSSGHSYSSGGPRRDFRPRFENPADASARPAHAKGVEYPEMGEVVVVRIDKVLNYGAIVSLMEYDNVTGFVHLSQVASGWIKNIRNFIKEGQVRAAKVLGVSREREQLELSLVKVTEQAQRSKIEAWKQLKRNKKLLEIMAEEQKKTFDDVWAEVAEPLLNDYESLQEAFLEIGLHGESKAASVPEAWRKPLLNLIEKNVELPKRMVEGVLEAHSLENNGVELIIRAAHEAESAVEGENVNMVYLGAGKFMLKSVAHDYKAATRILQKSGDAFVAALKKFKGTATFTILENK